MNKSNNLRMSLHPDDPFIPFPSVCRSVTDVRVCKMLDCALLNVADLLEAHIKVLVAAVPHPPLQGFSSYILLDLPSLI